MTPPRFPDEFWSKLRDHFHAAPSTNELPEVDRAFFAEWSAEDDAAYDDLLPEYPNPFSADEALALCIPEGYEANYPYPLVVWLHGHGGSELQWPGLMAQLSTQNYFGLGLRGPLTADAVVPGGYRWPSDEPGMAALEDRVHETVCQLRRCYHVHSERIYLAGFDEGATTALHLLLRKPEWFAGAVALGGRFPQVSQPLARYRDLQGARVLIAAGNRDRQVTLADLVQTGRLLHTAGMDVTTRIFDAAHEVTDEMLGEINHWLMEGIYAANVV